MAPSHSIGNGDSVSPKRIWASLITNLNYLPGLLTLHHSLYHPSPDPNASTDDDDHPPSHGSRYPFVAFYTSSFPAEGLKVLQARGIQAQWVPNVIPTSTREYVQDPRFAETWTKLVAFSLEEYERVVLLDGDILIRRNMDELMELELDSQEALDAGQGHGRVFAAAHACACNPMKKAHYPAHWYVPNDLPHICLHVYTSEIPKNCAYTTQHNSPTTAQATSPPTSAGVGMLNSGVLVITPSAKIYESITTTLRDTTRIEKYDFPDQELLSDVFQGQWVPLPYVYNALKTLRLPDVHGPIWQDAQVRALHYIFATKPWHEAVGRECEAGARERMRELDEPNRWWWAANWARQRLERERGAVDVFSGVI
ncbi:hypothetical protein N7492_007786 [Penicillium capsulatum]|uniref:Nucleotide-diphospho-sugar transferase n=1 Tax=Penicillium capsulatum TaxID=69766 RepID=A0A9W9LM06_9EURO|nr:hypothetical protein N7492_007786 [Penicillium capsulatum]KAJ6117618.1 hypothetical protein N7512_007343 [Penicillium capsulatum]